MFKISITKTVLGFKILTAVQLKHCVVINCVFLCFPLNAYISKHFKTKCKILKAIISENHTRLIHSLPNLTEIHEVVCYSKHEEGQT
jgi:hypothetical protein